MSTVKAFPDRKTPFDQASLWIAKMDKGLSPSEEQKVRRWIAKCDENREALFILAEQWDKMDSLSRLIGVFPQHKVAHRFNSKLSAALAASVVSLIFVGIIGFKLLDIFPNNNNQQIQNTLAATVYETAIGEQSSIMLLDGTEVLLNTDTRIEVDYSENFRLITLERGELHIEVAHDPNRPLSVLAGYRAVQAIGTAFNVQIADNNAVELVVTEGTVLVKEAPQASTSYEDISVSTVPNTFSVEAGYEVILGAEEETTKLIAQEDIQSKLSWHHGNLSFRGESLEQALTEVSRYTSVEFIILDEATKEVRVAGLFKAGDMTGLLSTLEENFNIKYTQLSDNQIELSSL